MTHRGKADVYTILNCALQFLLILFSAQTNKRAHSPDPSEFEGPEIDSGDRLDLTGMISQSRIDPH
jgi:hypothetical protein